MSDILGGLVVHDPAPRRLAGFAPARIKRRPLFLNDIRDLAHKKWEGAGRPPGDCTRFWREAEQEMRGAR